MQAATGEGTITEKESLLEAIARTLVVGLFITVFALFDYFGFNEVRWSASWKMVVYRIIQHLLLVGMGLLLAQLISWGAAVAFWLLWWTWWADGLYYAFFDTFKYYGDDPEYSAWQFEVVENRVSWAWWTPLGLLDRSSQILTYQQLMWQMAIGACSALLCVHLF